LNFDNDQNEDVDIINLPSPPEQPFNLNSNLTFLEREETHNVLTTPIRSRKGRHKVCTRTNSCSELELFSSASATKFRKTDNDHKFPSSFESHSFEDSLKRRAVARSLSFGNLFSTDMLPCTQSNGCKLIEPEVMHDLIKGKYKFFTRVIVIDARFPYEFDGGRIVDAINIPNIPNTDSYLSVLERLFFSNVYSDSHTTAIICHCEFSQKRGPALALALRNLDRAYNNNTYDDNHPNGILSYPQVYVLKGGYKTYFQKYPEDCFPQGYVSMFDKSYRNSKH